MIDNLSLAISHGLMLLAAWRLLGRADLDFDDRRKRYSFPRRLKVRAEKKRDRRKHA